jgi:hypothetical protein
MPARAGRTADAIATIASLQGDGPALQARGERLAAAVATSAFNQPNLRSTDRLLRCFGQPRRIAHECPATH